MSPSHRIMRSELIGGMDESRDNQSVTSDQSRRSSQARHVKRLSSKAGEAIDPLLSAVPFEVSEYQQATRCVEKLEKKRSYAGVLSDALFQPFLCCGMHPVE